MTDKGPNELKTQIFRTKCKAEQSKATFSGVTCGQSYKTFYARKLL